MNRLNLCQMDKPDIVRRSLLSLCGIIILLILISVFYKENPIEIYHPDKLQVINAETVTKLPDAVRIDSNGSIKGVFVDGPLMSATRGKYDIIVDYKTDNNESYVEIIAPTEVDENTGAVQVLQAFQLEQDSNTKIVTVNYDKDCIVDVRTFFGGSGFLEIKSIAVKRHTMGYHDFRFYVMLLIAAAIIWYGYKRNKVIKNYWCRTSYDRKLIYLCLLTAGICISYPLINPFLIHGHDLPFHLLRIEGIKAGLLAGQFPVRINPIAIGGYGYAAPAMYPELLLYFPALLRLMDVSMVTAYQLFVLTMNILTAFIAYFSFSRLSRSPYIGLSAAMIYTMAWYRLCDTYTRAAIGEMSAMTFLPLFVLGCYYLIFANHNKWWYALIGYTMLLQTHILSAMVAGIAALLAMTIGFIIKHEQARIVSCGKVLAGVILLNAWFIVPFLDIYKQDLLVKGIFVFVHDMAIEPANLFGIFDGESIGLTSVFDKYREFYNSLKLGGGVLLGIAAFLVTVKDKRYYYAKAAGAVCLLVGSIMAVSATTLFPWELIEQAPLLNKLVVIQFPWRMLGFATVFLAFVGGCGLAALSRRFADRRRFLVLSYSILYLFSAVYLGQYSTGERELYKYETVNFDLKKSLGNAEYLYKGTDVGHLMQRGSEPVASSGVKIRSFTKDATNIEAAYICDAAVQEAYIEMPLLYYPGYKASMDSGEVLAVVKGNNNVLRVIVLAGSSGNLKVWYSGKASYWTAMAISACYAAFLCLGWRESRSVGKAVRGVK